MFKLVAFLMSDYIGQPFNPNWGNYGIDSGGECGVPFNTRFLMPQNGFLNNWFSINYPLVHFTFFSTEHNFSAGSEQYQWLEQDLSSVDHSQKWLVVVGHRPMYSSNFFAVSEFTMNNHVREELEALFVKYRVGIQNKLHTYFNTVPCWSCYDQYYLL